MLSREIGYRRQHNRFAILLSQLRFHLSCGQYRCLLRIYQSASIRARETSMQPLVRSIWLAEINRVIDKSFVLLEEGQVPRSQMDRAVHLFQHLFLRQEVRADPGEPDSPPAP